MYTHANRFISELCVSMCVCVCLFVYPRVLCTAKGKEQCRRQVTEKGDCGVGGE